MAFPVRQLARRTAATLGMTALVLTPTVFGTAAFAADEGDTVTLLGFNDYHGTITASTNFACLVTTERNAAADSDATFLLSAGDNVGGTEFESFILNDEPALDYLNALGLDASAIGNHEFDQGQEDLNGRIQDSADFPYLSANIYRADGTRAYEPYAVIERNGVKIAVVGATTTKTMNKVSPAAIAGLEFRDPVAEVNKAVEEIKADETDIDMIIASYHEGASGNGGVDAAPANSDPIFEKIVAETSADVDVIYNGDSHRSYSYEAAGPDGSLRPVVQAGSNAGLLSSLTLSYTGGDWQVDENKLVANDTRTGSPSADQLAACAKDETFVAAQGVVDQAIADAAAPGAEQVGSIQGDVTTAWDASKAAYVDGVWTPKDPTTAAGSTKGDHRARHSAAGSMIADSMVWSAGETGRYDGQTLIGWMNPGGIRAELWYDQSGAEGDGVVTYKEAADQLPFANSLYTTEVTGAQFVQMLEEQWVRDENGTAENRFLAFSVSDNVSYIVDPSAELDEHVVEVYVNGEPIDPEGTYTIVGASFLVRDGGDGQHTLAQGQNTRDLGIVDRDAFAEYLKAHRDLAPNYEARQAGVTLQNPTEWDEARENIIGGAGITWEGATITYDEAPVYRVTWLESQSLGAPQIGTATLTTEHGTYTGEYRYDAELGWYADITLADWKCTPSTEGGVAATLTTDGGTGTELPLTLPTFDSVAGEVPGCDTPAPPADGDDDDETAAPAPPADGSDDDGSSAPAPAPERPSTPQQPTSPSASNGGVEVTTDEDGAVTVTTGEKQRTPVYSTPRKELARTGLEVAGIAAVAVGLIAAGGYAISRGRRNNG